MKSFQLVFFHPRNSDHVIRIENEVSNGDMRSRRWRTEGRYEYVIMITIICPSHPSNRCYQYNIRMLIHHFIIIWKQRKRFRKWKVFRYLIAGNSKIVYLVSHKIFIWVKIIMNEAWTKQTRLVWIPWQRWHNFPLEAVHEVRIQQVVQNRIKWMIHVGDGWGEVARKMRIRIAVEQPHVQFVCIHSLSSTSLIYRIQFNSSPSNIRTHKCEEEIGSMRYHKCSKYLGGKLKTLLDDVFELFWKRSSGMGPIILPNHH